MIVVATAAALTGGLTADAFALAAGHGGPFGESTEQSIGPLGCAVAASYGIGRRECRKPVRRPNQTAGTTTIAGTDAGRLLATAPTCRWRRQIKI
jgi:hypothetical protein